jgi:hypothetical protein
VHWVQGVFAVVPVYKGKGSPSSKASYRGIAVGSSISKLFSTMITHRLNTLAEKESMSAMGKAGFMNGGTPHNIFVLQHTLERARLHGKSVFAAFIDFRKTYDSIQRPLLWAAHCFELRFRA